MSSKKNSNLDITKIADAYSQMKDEKLKADNMFIELQKKIWKGETTGDILKDFIIVYKNKIPTPEDEKPYKDLEYEIKHHINEPILIISRREGIEGCPGIVAPAYINPMFLRITNTYQFGVVKEKTKLDIQSGKIILPMTGHLEYTDRYGAEKWKEIEGSISMTYYDFRNLNKNVMPRHRPMANNGSESFQHGMRIFYAEDALLYIQGAFDKLPIDSVEDTFISRRSVQWKALNEQALSWMKK